MRKLSTLTAALLLCGFTGAAAQTTTEGTASVIPTDGTFIRIKTTSASYSAQPYLFGINNISGNKGNGLVKIAVTDLTDEDDKVKTIFWYKDSKLTAYANGYYMNNTGGNSSKCTMNTAAGENAPITFTAGTTGTAAQSFTLKYASGNRYLYANYNSTSQYFADAYSNPNHEHCYFVYEAVTSLPVTIGATGYSTLNLPVAVQIPTGVTAYTAAKNEEGTALTLTALTGTIPANTPVVLQATVGTYDFTIATGEATTAAEAGTNALTGTTAAETVTASSVLTLQNVDGIGFYTYTGTELKGFKAYLTATAAAGATALKFDNTVTGINGATADTAAPKAIYDLQGRRVSKAVKGLYIINGTKVLVK